MIIVKNLNTVAIMPTKIYKIVPKIFPIISAVFFPLDISPRITRLIITIITIQKLKNPNK